MSIYDRDYYREDDRGLRWNLAALPGRWWILGLTAAAYLVQLAVENASPGNRFHLLRHFALSLGGLERFELWQPVTYLLLHGDFGHLFWNLVFLYFFGTVAESHLARGAFLRLYLVGGLAGAAGVVLWRLAGPPGHDPLVVGASGAVTAVLVWAALRAPRTPFLLFFVVPVPLWLLGALFVGLDAWRALTGTAGGIAVQAHLGGAAAGALLYFRPWAGASRARPRVRPSVRREPAPRTDPAERERQRGEEERVDRLLERIHASGMDSLTEEEREFLKRVSQKYRR